MAVQQQQQQRHLRQVQQQRQQRQVRQVRQLRQVQQNFPLGLGRRSRLVVHGQGRQLDAMQR